VYGVPPTYAPAAAWISDSGAGGVAAEGKEKFAGESGAADTGGCAVGFMGGRESIRAVGVFGLILVSFGGLLIGETSI
jgi:hypothetical protein